MSTAKAQLCGWCGKPLGDMSVGLNGKQYHLRPCFEEACAKVGSVVRRGIQQVAGLKPEPERKP